MDNHSAYSIAASHLGHLLFGEAFLLVAHDVFSSSLKVKKLCINRVTIDDVLHVSIVENLARHSHCFVEVDSVINNFANGELLIIIGDCNVGGCI